MILLTIFFTFLKIGLFTIGSGYSMLVLTESYIVDKYKWISLEEFYEIITISEVTPGPIIINVATFTGTKVAGLPGAIAATFGTVLIPFIVIFLIAKSYYLLKDSPYFQRLLVYLKPAAVGLIAAALFNLIKGTMAGYFAIGLAALVFIAVAILNLNPILVVITVFLLASFIK